MLAAVGPEVLVQLVMPVTPVIVHEPVPDGATAETGPVTVAVNVSVSPKLAVAAPAATVTLGVTAVTVVVVPEVGATPK